MKNIVVLGAGESGTGAALLAKSKGLAVFVSDKSPISEKYKNELIAAEIEFEEGNHTESRIFEADCVVKSPGIPDKIELIKNIKSKGIEVISEIEFGYRFLSPDTKIIAITGSNGKTTTTEMMFHILKTAGKNVAVGGNIGFSLARLAMQHFDWLVLEISSFQLDGIVNFKPNISILLNITPDHLDRYDYKMDNYIASKFKIAQNQDENDVFILNSDDENIATYYEKNMEETEIGQLFFISSKIFDGTDQTIDSLDNDGDWDTYAISLNQPTLQAPHNQFNAQCAAVAARKADVSTDDIQRALDTFKTPPHRLEMVATTHQICYINDSKATNVDSVFWALSAATFPTVLILGGQDKGNDYTQISALVHKKVIAIVAMGVDNQKIIDFFGKNIKVEEAKSAKEAVEKSTVLAKDWVAKNAENAADTGGGTLATVLLSPACASFDLFKNYEDRGNQFRAAAQDLK